MARGVDKKEWNIIKDTVDGVYERELQKQKELSEIIDIIDDDDLEALKNKLKKSPPINEIFKEHILGPVSPLGYAAYINSVECAQILLYFRANVNLHFNKTDALNCAIDNKSNGTFDLLLKHKATVEPRFLRDLYPRIIRATKGSYLYGVQKLLYYGSHPNLRDEEGKIALFHNLSISSPEEDDIQIGKILLDYGSITDNIDNQGLSIEDLAIEQSQKSFIEAAKIEAETLKQREEQDIAPTKDNPSKRKRRNNAL